MLQSVSNTTSPYATLAARMQDARDSQGGINVLPGAPLQALVGRIELLPDATELQAAVMETINEARTSIKADFHILKGTAGQEVARQLARRARQGLRVQLLAWGAPTNAFMEAVRAARALGLNVRVGRAQGMHSRNPVAKFLVADDRVALVGNPGHGGRAVRGLLRVTGEPACEVARQFNHDWAEAGGTPLPLAFAGGISRSAQNALLSNVQVGGHGPRRPEARGLVVAALQRAANTIEVLGDQLDDDAVLAALVAAHQRGVKVKVLLGAEDATPDGQAAAVARLQRAGVPVRRAQQGGTSVAVDLRFGVVDGESLLFGSQPWTRAGFNGGGDVLVEARGGREVALVRATFLHLWADAEEAAPPSRVRRLRARVAPVVAKLSQVARKYSPAAAVRNVLDLHVAVVRYPGGRWKVFTDVRQPQAA